MNPKDNDITPAILLQHMQGMEQRIMTRIDGLEAKHDNLEVKVDRIEAKVDRNHSQTMVALDNIDSRLDDIEVVQVPAIKKAVGMK